MTQPTTPAPALEFAVEIVPPDLTPWLEGNSGIPGITTLESGQPGPHVGLIALTHGNEFAGAIVLDRLLRADVTPARGRLSLAFINLAAFARFDPRRPTASRFIDEDLNRLWDDETLSGPRRSAELERAREVLPWVETVDVALDLHSMLWPSDPLILCGTTDKGRALARAIGTPALVVSDAGHANGKRIIDYGRFADPGTEPVAVLVEAGQHWAEATVATTCATVCGLLRHLGVVASDQVACVAAPDGPPRTASVTDAVMAMTGSFVFTEAYRGGVVIPRRNTLIAVDGTTEIRTPYDDCLLVMPSLRPSRGHTAVRLARFVEK